jgi:hypothetical protein
MEEGLTCDVAAEGMIAWRIGCSREVLVSRFAGRAGLRILENLADYGQRFPLRSK